MAKNDVTLTFRIKNAFGQGLTALRNGLSSMRESISKSKLATNALSVAFGVGLVGAIRLVKNAFVNLIASTAALEKQLANVKTLMSPDDVAKYGKELENAAKESLKLGFSIEDTGKAMFDTISAGVEAGQAAEFFAQAQRLAIGGVAELGVSVDGLTSVMNAYGKESFNATQASDAFFTAQKFGKTTVAELANNIGQVAPVAAKAGISFNETAAALSTLTLSGLRTDLAATGLKAVINGLIAPSKEAAEKMKELNIPVGATELKSKGLGFALRQVNKAYKENNDSLSEIFPNIRAFLGAAGLTESALVKYDDILKAVETDTDSLNNAVKIQTDTLDFQWKALMGTIKSISISIGNEFIPALKWLTRTLRETADFWSRLFGTKQKTQIEETKERIKELTDTYVALLKMQGNGVKVNEMRMRRLKTSIDIEIANLKKLRDAHKEANAEAAKGAGVTPTGQPQNEPKKTIDDSEVKEALKEFAQKERLVKAHNDALLQISKSKSLEELNLLQEQFDRERDLRVGELEREKEFLQEKNLLTLEKKKELDQAIADAETEHKSRIAALDDAELKDKQKKGVALQILESKRAKQLQGHLNTIASLQNSHNQALAVAGKAAAIANATMSTAAGVARALVDFPFPASIAIGGLVAAAGAAQIATIAGVQFATGSANVPKDMPATVHKGEIIVPKTFSDSLRSGDLTLSGKGDSTTNNNNGINVNIQVMGSVVGGSAKEIASKMHEIISNEIAGGSLTKFPTEVE